MLGAILYNDACLHRAKDEKLNNDNESEIPLATLKILCTGNPQLR